MDQAQKDLLSEQIKKMDAIRSEITTIKDKHQATYDDLEEDEQEEDEGTELHQTIEYLEQADNFLDEAITSLQEIIA